MLPDTVPSCKPVHETQHGADQSSGGKERVQAILCRYEVKLSMQQAMEAHRVVRRRRSHIY
jgi:hypothetical protein